MTAAVLVVVAVVAGALSGALEAAASALVRVTRASLADEADEARDRGAAGSRRLSRLRTLQKLADDEHRSLAAVRSARTVLEVGASAAFVIALGLWIDSWWVVLLVAVLVGLALAFVLSRVSPEQLGRSNPVGTLLVVARPLAVAVAIARPLVPVRGAEATAQDRTDAEAREVADRMSESEEFDEGERAIIRSVIELGQTLTREIMVPRTDMVTTRASTPLSKVLTLFERSGFSRVPVTGTSTDDLIGVAFFKDVVRAVQSDPSDGDQPVGEFVRSAMFVPESKPADDLLREMQAASSHIALVVDEYGGVAGLVTIEDALEELVGELTDEHDRPEPEVEDLGGGVLRVPARASVGELGELFDLHLDDDDVDTVGGLLAKALGKVPLPGASAEVEGLHLEAERVEGRRKTLATLRVHRTDDGAEATSYDTKEHQR
ncbi:hemolysin family protein [Paraoerskovia marina]|uniref:hemolysin family protein n=1 Tax=Paraoerskovia marina TaxID=545619 RepID=UPI0005BA9625|nr:hemolysin family protein [Paraoerskovia marina]